MIEIRTHAHPEPDNRRDGRPLYPWHALKVGESFFVPKIDASRAASIGACGQWQAKRHGKQFSRSKQDGGYKFVRAK